MNDVLSRPEMAPFEALDLSIGKKPKYFEREYFDTTQDPVQVSELKQLDDAKLHYLALNAISEVARRSPTSTFARLTLAGITTQGLRGMMFAHNTPGVETYSLIHATLINLLENYNEIAKNNSSLRNLAKASAKWPTVYSPNSTLRTNHGFLRSDLEVGATYPFQLLSKRQKKRPILMGLDRNRIALKILEALEKNRQIGSRFAGSLALSNVPEWVKSCKDLPDFHEGSADKWLELGWKAVMHLSNDHPESMKVLKGLGDNKKQNQPEGSKSELSAIRAEIKDTLKESFKLLARGTHESSVTKNLMSTLPNASS